MLPPIRPSQKYSNFDPEYTSLPVRFTFEEDFMKTMQSRRKSDPGLDITYNETDKNKGKNSPDTFGSNLANIFSQIGSATIYPSFAHKERSVVDHQ